MLCSVVVQAALPQSWMVPATTFWKHVAFLFYLRGAVQIILLLTGSHTHPAPSSQYVPLYPRATTTLVLNYAELCGFIELAEGLDRVVELVMT